MQGTHATGGGTLLNHDHDGHKTGLVDLVKALQLGVLSAAGQR